MVKHFDLPEIAGNCESNIKSSSFWLNNPYLGVKNIEPSTRIPDFSQKFYKFHLVNFPFADHLVASKNRGSPVVRGLKREWTAPSRWLGPSNWSWGKSLSFCCSKYGTKLTSLVGGDWNMNLIFPFTWESSSQLAHLFQRGSVNHQPDYHKQQQMDHMRPDHLSSSMHYVPP